MGNTCYADSWPHPSHSSSYRCLLCASSLAPILEPRCMLWLGYGVSLRWIRKHYPSVVLHEKKLGKRDMCRWSWLRRLDIQLSSELTAGARRTSDDFPSARCLRICDQPGLHNLGEGSQPCRQTESDCFPLPALETQRDLATARMGFSERIGLYGTNVYAAELCTSHWT